MVIQVLQQKLKQSELENEKLAAVTLQQSNELSVMQDLIADTFDVVATKSLK